MRSQPIYARKSTDEPGVGDDAKSVTRQLEHARAYAERKGWTVAEEHLYVDDGISGAEFLKRPGLTALLNALQPRRFDVLVMSDESKLGREQFQVGYLLSQFLTAGVRIHYYLEGREVQLGDATGKFLEQVRNFAAEMEREKARQRTADALLRKARQGYVTGGRVFGYTNVEIRSADGRRSHVERQIHPDEARVVTRIFTAYAGGQGFRALAKALNADQCPAPRPTKGGPSGWSHITVRDLTRNELYRGCVIYGRTQKRNAAGQKRPSRRPPEDWVRVEVPALRIIDEPLWHAAQAHRAQAATIYLRGTKGTLWGKPGASVESRYLLTGLATCGVCGSGLTVRSSGGSRRRFFYRCRAAAERGTICTNTLALPMALTDQAVLGYVEGVLLHPDVVSEALRRALAPDPLAEPVDVQATRLGRELSQVEKELAALVQAIASGEAPEIVLREIRQREHRRTTLQDALARLHQRAIEAPADAEQLRPRLLARLTDWRGLAARHVQQTRQLLRKLLVGRLQFLPVPTDPSCVRFRGEGTLAPLLGALQLSGVPAGVTPAGFEPAISTLKGSRPWPG